jgi:hypothetical protein
VPLLWYRDPDVFRGSFPSHFHAIYAGSKAVVGIESLMILEGDLPPRARSLVLEWAALRQNELLAAFEKVQAHEAPQKIEPLL